MRLTLLAACLLSVACAPLASTQGDVTLTATPSAARTVTLTLTNRSSSPVGYNLCTSGLQRREGGQWMNVPTDEVCTMEIRSLASGQSATFEKTPPQNAGPGEYRYVTGVEVPLNGNRVSVESNPFPL